MIGVTGTMFQLFSPVVWIHDHFGKRYITELHGGSYCPKIYLFGHYDPEIAYFLVDFRLRPRYYW
jgi:hypothetical protein